MSFLKSSSAPRHYRSPIKPYIRSMPHLPFEVFLLLLSYDQSPSVLAKLCLLNSEIYRIVIRYLYRRVELDKLNWERFLWGFVITRPKEGPGSFVFKPPKELLESISKHSRKEIEDDTKKNKRNSHSTASFDHSQKEKAPRPEVEPNQTTESRKRKAFELIRVLVINDIPNTTTASTLLHIVNSTQDQHQRVLLRGVRKLILHPQVLYSSIQWRHISSRNILNQYQRVHEHDFIKALPNAMPRPGLEGAKHTSTPISEIALATSNLDLDPTGSSSLGIENDKIHHDDDEFELEISGSLRNLCNYYSTRGMSLITSVHVPHEFVFSHSKELLGQTLTSQWKMSKFIWHEITSETLPLIPNAKKVQYHFVKPSNKSTNALDGEMDTLLSRVNNIRSILLETIAKGLDIKYKFIGTGLGIKFENDKSEIDVQERLMDQVKNSDPGHTLGTEVIQDEFWNDNVTFITSTSGLLSVEERNSRGIDVYGTGESECACYPVSTAVKAKNGQGQLQTLSPQDTRRTENEMGFQPYSQFIQNLSG
ncbi:hypothetical protein L486_06433 [Kwoniella mangroviensis CBS 10435]|uniref:F-box domain-containing protein n=1 Tax=Kwoniella mangroviensis CBS 10435 TaxID=1331196 RepID=A0A1B9IJG0_9TREE|nr:uncharacterized protein I203_05130 [Kwoniella mangroviensis CBS 8507]OCF55682.1 hypothetical protein L486_06433 [Kwoniella mangroviensis CBS 10435]OCF65455.1 hypothetical protein I203_05130 [Kwoniella mangroviensis CBS 8507]